MMALERREGSNIKKGGINIFQKFICLDTTLRSFFFGGGRVENKELLGCECLTERTLSYHAQQLQP